jgi:hypothetical protein
MQVSEHGLGHVARDIGLPKSGLKYFLEGTSPRRPTLRRLENWYLRVTAERVSGSSDEPEAIALAFLLRDLPDGLRPDAEQRALALWGEFFDSARLPRPVWLRRLMNGTS